MLCPGQPATLTTPHPPTIRPHSLTGELLDLVRGSELGGAVADCLAAAAAELDPLKQAALLKASCYGRAFRQLEAAQQRPQQGAAAGYADGSSSGGGLDSSSLGGVSVDPRRQTVEVARRLRVLNALRDPSGCCALGGAGHAQSRCSGSCVWRFVVPRPRAMQP